MSKKLTINAVSLRALLNLDDIQFLSYDTVSGSETVRENRNETTGVITYTYNLWSLANETHFKVKVKEHPRNRMLKKGDMVDVTGNVKIVPYIKSITQGQDGRPRADIGLSISGDTIVKHGKETKGNA